MNIDCVLYLKIVAVIVIGLHAFTTGQKLTNSPGFVPVAAPSRRAGHLSRVFCSSYHTASYTTPALAWSPLQYKSVTTAISLPPDVSTPLPLKLNLRAMSITSVLDRMTPLSIWSIR